MRERYARLLRRLQLGDATAPAVHFHSGPQGSPVVCDAARCTSPHLDV